MPKNGIRRVAGVDLFHIVALLGMGEWAPTLELQRSAVTSLRLSSFWTSPAGSCLHYV